MRVLKFFRQISPVLTLSSFFYCFMVYHLSSVNFEEQENKTTIIPVSLHGQSPNLPDELLVKIFCEFDSLRDFLSISRVSRQFNRVAWDYGAIGSVLAPFIRSLGAPPLDCKDKGDLQSFLKDIFGLPSINEIIEEVNSQPYALKARWEANDKFVSLGFRKAILNEIETGVNGRGENFEENRAKAVELLNKWAGTGDSAGRFTKFLFLYAGWHKTEKKPDEAREILEKLVEEEYGPALQRKSEFLALKSDEDPRYKKYIIEAQDLIAKRIKNNDPDVQYDLIEEFFEGNGIYYRTSELSQEARLQIGRERIDALVAKGDHRAIDRKIYGLTDKKGEYGYPYDLAAAKAIIEELADKKDTLGIKRKIEGMTLGEYGYSQDESAAKEFIENLINQKNRAALLMKIKGLIVGKYGFIKETGFLEKYLFLCGHQAPTLWK